MRTERTLLDTFSAAHCTYHYVERTTFSLRLSSIDSVNELRTLRSPEEFRTIGNPNFNVFFLLHDK